MAVIDTVKTALRINHDILDGDIERLIGVAQDELIRVGVDGSLAISDDSLIKQAIVTFCQSQMESDIKKVERFEASWLLQIDNLRKSGVPYESTD